MKFQKYLTAVIALSFIGLPAFSENERDWSDRNIRSLNHEVRIPVSESQELYFRLQEKKLHPSVRKTIEQHKIFLTNYAGSKAKARNCSELLELDPYMISGVYSLYGSRSKVAVQRMYCAVEDKKIVQTRKLELPRTADHKNTERLETRRIKCDPGICRIQGLVVDEPKLLSQKEGSNCLIGTNFGVNSVGLWVKSGCDGIFQVSYYRFPYYLDENQRDKGEDER